MKLLYLITKLVTYPGAFMKGFWEHCACRMVKLQVRARQYLPADWHCGHAEHDPAGTPAKAFLLALLPYVAQRALGWVFLGASVSPLLIFGLRGGAETSFFWLEVVALFLGLSLLCNSFPAWEDAKRQWHLFYGKPGDVEEFAAVHEAIAPAVDAVVAAVEERLEAREEESDEEIAEEIAEGALEEIIENAIDQAIEPVEHLPKFARLPAKIILAPCNAYFLAGAWLERHGIPAILAVGLTVALLILRS
jgi:hypothetical protein